MKMTPERRAQLSKAAKAAWTPERRERASKTWHEVRSRPRASTLDPVFWATIPSAEEWAAQQAKLAGGNPS